MSPSYHISEPHPSVPKARYIYSGRGGAGNAAYYSSTQITDGPNAHGPASKITLKSKPASPYYMSGRGGAGNLARESERAMFSFDEELARQAKMMENQAPIFHVGRGGAGNAYDELAERRRTSAASNASTTSTSSVRQSLEGVMGKIHRSLSRH